MLKQLSQDFDWLEATWKIGLWLFWSVGVLTLKHYFDCLTTESVLDLQNASWTMNDNIFLFKLDWIKMLPDKPTKAPEKVGGGGGKVQTLTINWKVSLCYCCISFS